MISGRLLNGNVAISSTGVCTLGASVELVDDVHGSVGQRGIPVDDPQVIAQVQAFVAQMLPSLSATAGFEITMPAPAPEPEPES